MAEPTVSAVILAFNLERFIAEAIESVLAQTHPCEIVIVDNGSTDGTLEIVRGYGDRVRLEVEPRRGIGLARNAGLDAARAEFIAFLDGDDLWEPGKTEAQLAAFGRTRGLDLVFGHVLQVLDEGLDPERRARLRAPETPQPGLHLGAMMARRETWDRVGRWDRGWDSADGLAWFARARELGLREEMLPDLVTIRRIHGANQTLKTQDTRGEEWARILKASLDRRRRAGP